MPEIQKVGATPIKELASVKGNEKLLLNQDAYEKQQRSIPVSPSAQQFNVQARGGGNLPQSPTMANMNVEDRHSQERQSAEGQYTSSSRNNNYNQQYNDQDQQQQYYNQQQQQQPQQQQQQQQPPQQVSKTQNAEDVSL